MKKDNDGNRKKVSKLTKKRIIVLAIILVLIIYVGHMIKVIDLCLDIEHGRREEAKRTISRLLNVNCTTGIYSQFVYIEMGACSATPLLSACSVGDEELISLLLNRGANANFSVTPYDYPLEQYTNTGYDTNTNILRLLIEHGANPNAYRNKSPLSHIASRASRAEDAIDCYDEVADILYLLDHGAEKRWPERQINIIHYASIIVDTKLLKTLLEEKDKNEYIDEQNSKGKTPLMWAVKKGFADHVKLLVKNGAKIELKDKEGKTAIDYAKEMGNEEILKILIDG